MELIEVSLWIPAQFIKPATQKIILQEIIKSSIPEDWAYECNHYNAAKFGDSIAAMRCHVQIVKMCENGRGSCS